MGEMVPIYNIRDDCFCCRSDVITNPDFEKSIEVASPAQAIRTDTAELDMITNVNVRRQRKLGR